MTDKPDLDTRAFVRDLLKLHAAVDLMDLDGGDMEDLYRRHGFLVDRVATAQDVDPEFFIEEGDKIMVWTPAALELMKP